VYHNYLLKKNDEPQKPKKEAVGSRIANLRSNLVKNSKRGFVPIMGVQAYRPKKHDVTEDEPEDTSESRPRRKSRSKTSSSQPKSANQLTHLTRNRVRKGAARRPPSRFKKKRAAETIDNRKIDIFDKIIDGDTSPGASPTKGPVGYQVWYKNRVVFTGKDRSKVKKWILDNVDPKNHPKRASFIKVKKISNPEKVYKGN